MSTETGGDQNTQGSVFDFRTLVSLASLAAAAAAIYYAASVDASDKIADLESSLMSLNTKVNVLPTEDGVKQLISENVTIPPPGPSAEDVQAMIDKSTLTSDDVQALISKSILTADDVTAQIAASTLSAGDVQAMIDESTLTPDAVQARIDQITLAADDVRGMLEEPLNEIRTTVAALPNEARVLALAKETADTSVQTLIEAQIPALIATAVPKGAVVAFATACPAESGWKEYEAARGRFLVAVGDHTDASGHSRNFALGIGDNDGEYMHTLVADEMPAHRHAVERQGPTRGIEGLPPIGSDGAIIATIEQEMSSTAGKGAPHNTVPPYIALHFCEKT